MPPPSLREMGLLILPSNGNARAAVTKAENGIAISIHAKRLAKQTPEVQSKLSSLCRNVACIRLTINEDIFISREAPVISMGISSLNVPDNSFLQADPEAEREMQDIVSNALANCQSIADLFCGVGTFALPLARMSRIAAYDSDIDAIDALNKAAHHTQRLKPLTASRRDLFRQPLGVREFKGIDGVVINPPRAGALKQCEQLAASPVETVVMVSCNPVTFTRDARILISGGYSIGTVHPIDQFLWSPHLELVAAFTRH